MSEGELLHLQQIYDYNTAEPVYLDIIYKKTAYLFGACLAIGAKAAGAPTAQIATLRQVGEYIGMAFQLNDDWLDYSAEELDKPLGMDLKEGQIILPLIHALQQAPKQTKKTILSVLRQTQRYPQQREKILTLVRRSSDMDYTRKMMLKYQHQALQILANITASPHQKALCALIRYMI